MMRDMTASLARHERWRARREAIERQALGERERAEAARKDSSRAKEAAALLQYVSGETCRATEEQTAQLATHALREVFHDQELKLLVEHDNYRGHPSVTFKLKDEKTGVVGDPMDSFGGGPACVLGVVLQAISVVRQPEMAHVLFLDEPMVQVSESYQEAAAKLLRRLCEPPLNFNMLVITHSPVIADAAHRRYRAVKEDDGARFSEESADARS